MLKILHITSNLDGGGIDRIIYNYFLSLSPKGFSFDFAITSTSEGILEDDLKRMGCKIYHIPQLKKSFFTRNRLLKRIMVEGKYDVVHDHSSYKAFFSLRIAKKIGIKKRVAHAHSAMITMNKVQLLIKKVLTKLTIKVSTDLFACGEYAQKWAWGNKKSSIIPNAIFLKDYSFSQNIRYELRYELNVSDKCVLGTVSRLSPEKNHLFLISAFQKMLLLNPNCILVIVGSGNLENEIRNYISQLKLEDKIILLGIRKDVQKLLNAFDLFLLPSKFEGVPVTIIEAEANGLPCLISDSVTKEIRINKNLEYLSIHNGVDAWAQKMSEMAKVQREDPSIFNSVYNIDIASKILEDKYYESK